MDTVGPEIRQETLKEVENEKVHFRTWNRGRKLKTLKNEKGIL